MIIDLPSTTTQAVSKKLVQLRQDVGAMSLTRVLTLVVVADEADIDEAVEVANDASHQHPCRIVAVARGTPVELDERQLPAVARAAAFLAEQVRRAVA